MSDGQRGDAPKRSATQRAYDFAKAEILSGAYPPGELITEGQVSDALGVSRTPVREAFMLLAAEGLLRLYPKRGALVVPVTWLDVDQALEARRLVERWAVEKLVGDDAPVDLEARLHRALAEEERAVAQGTRAFYESGRAFAQGLVGAAGNGMLTAFHDSLLMRQLRMGQVAVDSDPAAYPPEDVLRHHRRLVDAVLRRDGPAALALVDEHVARTRGTLRPRA